MSNTGRQNSATNSKLAQRRTTFDCVETIEEFVKRWNSSPAGSELPQQRRSIAAAGTCEVADQVSKRLPKAGKTLLPALIALLELQMSLLVDKTLLRVVRSCSGGTE